MRYTVPSLGRIFVMHTSGYKMVLKYKKVKMKTPIKKLKLWVLLTGLVFLTSCGSDIRTTYSANINAIYRTIPSLAITATKHTGNKISKYLANSISAQNSNRLSGKKAGNAGRKPNVIPISIGIAGGVSLSWPKQ